jgi:hypothetical protein
MVILRRDGRVGHQPVVRRVFLERIEEELRGTAHHRIGFLEIFLVAAELIAIPQVVTQPRAAARPHAGIREVNGSGGTPEIRVVVGDPAACAIHFLRCARASHRKVFDHRDEGFHAFA